MKYHVFKNPTSPYPQSFIFCPQLDISHLKFRSIFYSHLILHLQVGLAAISSASLLRSKSVHQLRVLFVLNNFFAQFWARVSTILAEVSRAFPQFLREISRYHLALGLEQLFSFRLQFTLQLLNAQKTWNTDGAFDVITSLASVCWWKKRVRYCPEVRESVTDRSGARAYGEWVTWPRY
jgi:hypothetical protein